MKTYLGRMKAKDICPPRKPMPLIIWSWLGSLLGIYAIGVCTPVIASSVGLDGAFILGSFGAAAVAVSSSVLFMHLTRSMHPPGGATALIAVVGGDGIRELGYWYVLFPVLGGALMLLAVALVVNNLSRNPHRHYPTYWF